MTERRYNEEEMAAIFERAAELQPSAGPKQKAGSTGMTLAELQEIGREVGISPDAVARAAAAFAGTGSSSARRFLGLPIGVGRTVDLGRRLSEEEWERLVVDLRNTFDARGNVRTDGSFRQWTNGNLQVLLEPTTKGSRLRMRTVKGDARALMNAGIGTFAISAVSFIATMLAGGSLEWGGFGGAGFLSMVGIGMFSLGALRLPGWARLRRRQMEEIAVRTVSETSDPVRLLDDGEQAGP